MAGERVCGIGLRSRRRLGVLGSKSVLEKSLVIERMILLNNIVEGQAPLMDSVRTVNEKK